MKPRRSPSTGLVRNWRWLVRDYDYAIRVRSGIRARRWQADFLDGHLDPVVLLPGVYETWEFLRPVAERLNALGHPVHVVFELGRNTDPIPDAAAIAQRYLESHDLRHVSLVAHSKGGLIGKHMMMQDDVEGRIDRLVAIASPFAGSSYSRYMPNRPLRAFLPTAATMVKLAANAEVNSRITSIYGPFDTHIPEGSELPGATNVLVDISGHFLPLADELVLAAVERAVAAPAH